MKEEGRRKKEERRRKKEEGRKKKEEGRRKKEEGRRKKGKLLMDSQRPTTPSLTRVRSQKLFL
ncbi:MAG: hypothetical protein SWX82_10870 [Cyanobacteriota bacterium]|nr:hypothetical protein [Cyanobacteriota bacterium]